MNTSGKAISFAWFEAASLIKEIALSTVFSTFRNTGEV
jgi:hypothetical protein